MKNLKDIITERLHITKQTKVQTYNYFPKTKEELMNLIEDRLWGKNKDLNANLNDIDVSQITDMSNLFLNRFPHNIDISEWDVSNVTDMNNMFRNCHDFDCDLSKWDVRKVKNMRYMFYNCKKFKGKGLDKWDPVNCTDMYGMFTGCTVINNSPKWYKQ